MILARLLFSLLAIAMTSAGSAGSENVPQPLAEKPISLIIGYNPGGSYDTYSRLAAAWLPLYLPGHPTIVPKNMPGVASIKAANYLFTQAPADGTTIGMIGQALALDQALRNGAIQFDMRKFKWIGRFAPSVENTIVWHNSPTKTVQDAMHRETLLAATSAGSTTDVMPRLMNRIVGTQFKIIKGYAGSAGAAMAMERGEVDGTHSSVADLLFVKPKWLRDQEVSVLVQYAQHRHPDFPDVPAMVEFAKTEADKQLLSLFASTADLGRALLAPPGIPADRPAALRSAFASMIADPLFQQEVAKRKMELGPISGEQVQKLIQETLEISPAVAARAVAISNE
jgi:tripartite-type tricarboxylate transporter receptor subunit TctC